MSLIKSLITKERKYSLVRCVIANICVPSHFLDYLRLFSNQLRCMQVSGHKVTFHNYLHFFITWLAILLCLQTAAVGCRERKAE
jgi:hypothetical protein